MKFISALLVLFTISCRSQNIDSTWFASNYEKREQYITMRDGTKLFTSIYSPKDQSEKHPILITRTPYSAAPYGTSYRPLYSSFYKEYLREKYIMIIQDVRGRWMSEGTFEDIRPFVPKKTGTQTDEASDTYDTIEWLLKNVKSNNGKVGIYGISYPGFYSTMAALSGHPALKAVSPQAPVTEWFIGDDFHHNGAFMLMDAFNFYSNFGRPRPAPISVAPPAFEYYTKDNYQFYLDNTPLSKLTKTFMGDSIKFWNDLMLHDSYDNWWKSRNITNYLKNIQPAVLVVGGLFDAEDLYGAWKTYKTIEEKSPGTNNKIVMGPWFHGGWTRSKGSSLGNIQFGSNTSEWYHKNIELPFFNYHLKGIGKPDIAEATIFFTGENSWKKLASWPPAEVQNTDLYLATDNKLSWQPIATTATGNSYTEYKSDPKKPVPYTEDVHFKRTREYMTDDQRFAARRPDVLVFETDTLKNALTLAGPVVADLQVSTTGTDADFIVKLIDVFPNHFSYSDSDNYIMNGYQMLVRGEVMRGKFRNNFEVPEPFKSGTPTRVSFALPDVAHTFKPGHKLMIQIQSTWFPLVDINPQTFTNIYTAQEHDFKEATIQILHNPAQQSKVILPVYKQ